MVVSWRSFMLHCFEVLPLDWLYFCFLNIWTWFCVALTFVHYVVARINFALLQYLNGVLLVSIETIKPLKWFSECTVRFLYFKNVQLYNTGWAKGRRALDCFLYLWLKFREGIDKYWIVPVKKLFYFHRWESDIAFIHASSLRIR